MRIIPYGKLVLRTGYSEDMVEKIIKEHIRDLEMEQAFYAQRAGVFMGKMAGKHFAIGPWFCWRLCGQTIFEGEIKSEDTGSVLEIVTRGSYLQCALYYLAIIGITVYNFLTATPTVALAQLAVLLIIYGFFVHCFWEDVDNFKEYLCEVLKAREPARK